jgi:hypothetical protein
MSQRLHQRQKYYMQAIGESVYSYQYENDYVIMRSFVGEDER